MNYPKTLNEWFQFSDRDKTPYNPTVTTTITIDQLWYREVNEFNSATWKREEWFYASALVPLDQLYDAARVIKSPHDLRFGFGWDLEDQFIFGKKIQLGKIKLYPIVIAYEHPVSHELTVEICREFIHYHALQNRNQSQYYHPLENLVVAETTIDTHKLFNPTTRVTIHRDYIKDFLAATGMGLLISLVADRFANAPTEEELELVPIENEQIDEFTSISANIHTPKITGHDYYRGRSILYRNYIIEPYDSPKYERSPWPYFGKRSVSESEYPKFIVNDEGEKIVLPQNTFLGNYVKNGVGTYGYLHFRPEALQKYLQTPGYSVFFHMRNWGVASLPGDRGTIDVGINSHGLINAFAPDIAKLNLEEQAYWASFSSLPNGEICTEMFQTRMELNPPHSPGTIDLIQGVRSQLISIFQNHFSVDLYSDYEPNHLELCKLSVGPISNQYTEVTDLAKIMYGWVIETMQIDHLRKALTASGGKVDLNLRQIRLVEKILMTKGLDSTDARSMTAPIAGLYDLRISSAHLGNLGLESSFQLMGVRTIPPTPREGWFVCVDAITGSLNSIANVL